MKILAAWLLAALPAAATACDGLQVEGGWIRQPPPTVDVAAGYARLSNGTGAALQVDRVSSDRFGGADLHQTLVEDAMSRMRRALPLPIHAGAVRVLEPGGYHLMLFRPREPLAAGDTVTVTLHCGEDSVSAPFDVRTDPP